MLMSALELFGSLWTSSAFRELWREGPASCRRIIIAWMLELKLDMSLWSIQLLKNESGGMVIKLVRDYDLLG